MQRSDRSSLSATRGRAQPVPDALAEFRSERPAPIEPATARPAPPPPDTRRARPATVASAVRAIGSDKREKLWSFAFGLVCGALLCLVVVYPLMTSELPRPAPASQTLLEQPPAAEPSIVVADEHRDPPVPDPPVVNTSRPPTPEAARPTPTPEAARPTPAPTDRLAPRRRRRCRAEMCLALPSQCHVRRVRVHGSWARCTSTRRREAHVCSSIASRSASLPWC